MGVIAAAGLRGTRNVVPGAYRGVSVTRVDDSLLAGADVAVAVERFLLGREVYRRTRFVVLHDSTGRTAVVSVEKATQEPLFTAVRAVELLAGPDETAFVVEPDADTAVPSELARVAGARAAGARAVVVRGRYEHVSFIVNPAPITVVVQEIVPPWPAKLADQVRRLLAVAEDLPPMLVQPDLVDLDELSRSAPAASYLLPCRGSGVTIGDRANAYLDERPPRQDWALLGCARSREIHRWFYGDEPPAVDTCPRSRGHDDAVATVTKCCLLERANSADGRRVVVPWGASLDQVRAALRTLADLWEPQWRPV
jgi:hypothetical protein